MALKVHHLNMKEAAREEYWLAVHTAIEAHQLVFYINQSSSIYFKRAKEDLENEIKEGIFQLFEWEDHINDYKCQLISNKYVSEKSQTLGNNNTLFDIAERNQVSLFTEYKKVDFFIKSTNNTILKSIKKMLLNWSLISLIHTIPYQRIKNQSLLIFDQ